MPDIEVDKRARSTPLRRSSDQNKPGSHLPSTPLAMNARMAHSGGTIPGHGPSESREEE